MAAEPAPSASSESTAQGTLDAELVGAFQSAQDATISAVGEVAQTLQEGMSEVAVAQALEAAVRDRGFDAWFQRPRVQFGAPADPRRWMSDKGELTAGTVVEIHLAPANRDAFGSLGHAFVFGGGPEPEVVRLARELCRATCGFASRWKTVGEIYVYADAWANNRRHSLDRTETVGHVCFPRRGRAGWLWPYGARTAVLMRRHQIQWFNPRRTHGVYCIAPRIIVDGQGCSFGEMVLIDGDTKAVVGRSHDGELGLERIGQV